MCQVQALDARQLIKQTRPLASGTYSLARGGGGRGGNSTDNKGQQSREGKTVNSHGGQADRGEGVSGRGRPHISQELQEGSGERGEWGEVVRSWPRTAPMGHTPLWEIDTQ